MNGVMAGRAELVCVANANHLKAKTRENITNSDRIIISWKCLSKICVKFCFFVLLRRKHDLRWRISTFVLGEGGGGVYDECSSKNPEFEPLVSTWELSFWSPWPHFQERLDMRSGCHAAKIFPVGVRGTGCLSSLVSRLELDETDFLFSFKYPPYAMQTFFNYFPLQ